MTPRVLVRYAALVVGALAATRLSYLFVERALGNPFAKGFKVEAAGTVLAIAGALVLALSKRTLSNSERPSQSVPLFYWPLFVLASFVVFWPALWVGLLSDDFVLILKADHGQLGAVTTSVFRPVLLAVWSLFRVLGAGPVILHAWSIGLHGTAAFLTARLTAGWLSVRWAALGAGVLFLIFPVAVEPVTWISGGFDLLATVLVLVMIGIARRYDQDVKPRVRVLFFAIAFVALFSKETAAVAGILVMCDAVARRAVRRELLVDAAVFTAIAAVYGVGRVLAAGGVSMFHLDKYMAQRGVFQTIGGLAQQWPALSTAPFPWQAVVSALGLTTLILLFLASAKREQARLVFPMAVWVLAAVAPVLPWILISRYLEDSRYLYLAAPAWAAFVVMIASVPLSRARVIGPAILAVLIVMSVWATRVQLGAWVEASALRDDIMRALVSSPAVRACPEIEFIDYPDSVRGAYVFRNGPPEAMIMAGLPRMRLTAPAGCRFQWNNSTRELDMTR